MPRAASAACCSTICATRVRARRAGCDRRLAESTFRHLHDLSLRFHLERRTGAVTKIIERGTKSIDMMLYFLLFNIAPTIVQLMLVLGLFWVKFGLRPGRRDAGDGGAYITYTRHHHRLADPARGRDERSRHRARSRARWIRC
jgi:hypothetical protein